MQIIIVTGMSGAGRSTALKAFEDIGYIPVDNLPLRLLPALIDPSWAHSTPPDRLAIGVDIRSEDFSSQAFLSELLPLRHQPEHSLQILFLDCEDEMLRKRYSETRRRHPLAQDRPVTVGILLERERIEMLQAQADSVIDTTDFTPADLKRTIHGKYAEQGRQLSLFIISFSYRYGVPREADLVFDVRFLTNPHYVPELKNHTGKDLAVQRYIEQDEGYRSFFKSLESLLLPLLPRYQAEGKSYLTIAIGCTGGRHRSVCITEQLCDLLKLNGFSVTVRHRDMQRKTA